MLHFVISFVYITSGEGQFKDTPDPLYVYFIDIEIFIWLGSYLFNEYAREIIFATLALLFALLSLK